MQLITEPGQENICLTCFLLGKVWNKDMLYRHGFSTLL